MASQRTVKANKAGKSMIPEDVIEAILSKLPVKSLIRFQTLSKSNKGLISNPWFLRSNYSHLSKSSPDLFLHCDLKVFNRSCMMRLVSTGGGGSLILQRVAAAELGDPPPFGSAYPLCCCNGIVLLSPWKRPCSEFTLWNPSIRRYAVIPMAAPESVDMGCMIPGFYHDSRTDDYKVVIISVKGGMVYSCKTRSWSREQLFPCGQDMPQGFFDDGCFYWVNQRQILFFDFRERKTEELKGPDDLAAAGELKLELTTCWWGRLCLLSHPCPGTDARVWLKEDRGWRDVGHMSDTPRAMRHVLLKEDRAAPVGSFSRCLINNRYWEKGCLLAVDQRFRVCSFEDGRGLSSSGWGMEIDGESIENSVVFWMGKWMESRF